MSHLNDPFVVSKTRKSKSCQNPSCQQLAERVRELERELMPDSRYYPIPQLLSPYSAITPCSNNSFLLSPNAMIAAQRFNVSSRLAERAHDIPYRFWKDWHEKQQQNRTDDILNSNNRRKSFLSYYQNQYRPQSFPLDRIVSSSIDSESQSTSTDELDSIVFNRRSNENLDISPIAPTKPQSTLDRSRLTIPLPFSYANLPSQSTDCLSVSSAGSNEAIAQIDTEFQMTILSQENETQNNPLLYSKAILNRHVELRSLTKKEFQTYYFTSKCSRQLEQTARKLINKCSIAFQPAAVTKRSSIRRQ